jgi:CheY-like chemotaxis protein
LVDDEKDIVEMLEQLLERFGYRVTAFTSSIDALVAFKTNPHSFDLILSDMTMPNKTGIELAMEIKRTRPEIPFILCTGFSDQINEAKCEALGIQGLVMKPVISNVLAKTIRAALDSKSGA